MVLTRRGRGVSVSAAEPDSTQTETTSNAATTLAGKTPKKAIKRKRNSAATTTTGSETNARTRKRPLHAMSQARVSSTPTRTPKEKGATKVKAKGSASPKRQAARAVKTKTTSTVTDTAQDTSAATSIAATSTTNARSPRRSSRRHAAMTVTVLRGTESLAPDGGKDPRGPPSAAFTTTTTTTTVASPPKPKADKGRGGGASKVAGAAKLELALKAKKKTKRITKAQTTAAAVHTPAPASASRLASFGPRRSSRRPAPTPKMKDATGTSVNAASASEEKGRGQNQNEGLSATTSTVSSKSTPVSKPQIASADSVVAKPALTPKRIATAGRRTPKRASKNTPRVRVSSTPTKALAKRGQPTTPTRSSPRRSPRRSPRLRRSSAARVAKTPAAAQNLAALPPSEPPLSSARTLRTVAQLRAVLRLKGLSTHGRKAELQLRLEQAFAAESKQEEGTGGEAVVVEKVRSMADASENTLMTTRDGAAATGAAVYPAEPTTPAADAATTSTSTTVQHAVAQMPRTVEKLRSALRAKGLSSRGRKVELQARLLEALDAVGREENEVRLEETQAAPNVADRSLSVPVTTPEPAVPTDTLDTTTTDSSIVDNIVITLSSSSEAEAELDLQEPEPEPEPEPALPQPVREYGSEAFVLRPNAGALFASPGDRIVPRRGRQGPKEYEPTSGDLAQAEKEQNARLETLQLARVPRQLVLKSMMIGLWDAESRQVLVPGGGRGPDMQSMGRAVGTATWLLPEEALYLVDKARLEVYVDEVPLSLQETVALFLDAGFALPLYTTYAYFKRIGYVVRRHESPAEGKIMQQQEQLFGSSSDSRGDDEITSATDGNEGGSSIASVFSWARVAATRVQALMASASAALGTALTPAWTDTEGAPLLPRQESLTMHHAFTTLRDVSQYDASSHLPLPVPSPGAPDESRLSIDFDIFRSANRSFRKSDPGAPAFCVVVVDFRDTAPSVPTLQRLQREAGESALKFVVNDAGTLCFYGLMDLDIPIFAPRAPPTQTSVQATTEEQSQS